MPHNRNRQKSRNRRQRNRPIPKVQIAARLPPLLRTNRVTIPSELPASRKQPQTHCDTHTVRLPDIRAARRVATRSTPTHRPSTTSNLNIVSVPFYLQIQSPDSDTKKQSPQYGTHWVSFDEPHGPMSCAQRLYDRM